MRQFKISPTWTSDLISEGKIGLIKAISVLTTHKASSLYHMPYGGFVSSSLLQSVRMAEQSDCLLTSKHSSSGLASDFFHRCRLNGICRRLDGISEGIADFSKPCRTFLSVNL